MKDIVTFLNESIDPKEHIMEAYKTEDYKQKCFYISYYIDEGVLNGDKVIQPIIYMDKTSRLSYSPRGEYASKTFKNYKTFQKFLNEVVDDTWVEEKEEGVDTFTKKKFTQITYKRVNYPNYKELMKYLGNGK